MGDRKLFILACFLATCCASQRNISQYIDADDTQQGPLCYHCSFLITDPSVCTHKARCSRDEICMLHERMPGADGSKRFTAQCETELVCQNLRNHAKKRSHVFCHNCCKQDLCNNHCGSTPTTPMHIPTTPTPTPPKPVPTTTLAPTPKQTSATAATTTKSTHHISFPIMCYSCKNMVNPSLCNHLVTCPKGFGCMLQKVGVNADSQILYTSSCEPDWLCNRMPNVADALIGKRSGTSHLDLKPEVEKRSNTCDRCCHQHLCNNQCNAPSNQVSATPPPHRHTTHKPTHTTHKPTHATHKPTHATHKPTHTTHKPTHATTTHTKQTTTNAFSATPLHVKTRGTTVAHATPHYNYENCIKHNFTSIPYINLCFKMETVSLKYDVAERWCGFYGATLAILDDAGKFSVVETVLRYEPHFHNEVLYIGGHQEFSNGTYYWPNHKRVSVGSWSGLSYQHSTGKCIGLDGTSGFQMAFIDCDIYRKFICTIDTS